MKALKVFHCRTSKTGRTTPVRVIVTKYTNPESLAILLQCAKSPWEDFAVITVNLASAPYGDVKTIRMSHMHSLIQTIVRGQRNSSKKTVLQSQTLATSTVCQDFALILSMSLTLNTSYCLLVFLNKNSK